MGLNRGGKITEYQQFRFSFYTAFFFRIKSNPDLYPVNSFRLNTIRILTCQACTVSLRVLEELIWWEHRPDPTIRRSRGAAPHTEVWIRTPWRWTGDQESLWVSPREDRGGLGLNATVMNHLKPFGISPDCLTWRKPKMLIKLKDSGVL